MGLEKNVPLWPEYRRSEAFEWRLWEPVVSDEVGFGFLEARVKSKDDSRLSEHGSEMAAEQKQCWFIYKTLVILRPTWYDSWRSVSNKNWRLLEMYRHGETKTDKIEEKTDGESSLKFDLKSDTRGYGELSSAGSILKGTRMFTKKQKFRPNGPVEVVGKIGDLDKRYGFVWDFFGTGLIDEFWRFGFVLLERR